MHSNTQATLRCILEWKCGWLLTVLKYSTPVAENASAISFVVATQATGCPFPIGFPIVTISGIKSSPWSWNAQKCLPTLPKPTWISSAINTPPALCICLLKEQEIYLCRNGTDLIKFRVKTKISPTIHFFQN